MTIRTRRWNDRREKGDGLRVLVCRYRPRGVRKEDETWDVWLPALGPSRELHADFYGKRGPPIRWGEYRRRYLAEMRERPDALEQVAAKLRDGKNRHTPVLVGLSRSGTLPPDPPRKAAREGEPLRVHRATTRPFRQPPSAAPW